jgi:hypothetical protein
MIGEIIIYLINKKNIGRVIAYTKNKHPYINKEKQGLFTTK